MSRSSFVVRVLASTLSCGLAAVVGCSSHDDSPAGPETGTNDGAIAVLDAAADGARKADASGNDAGRAEASNDGADAADAADMGDARSPTGDTAQDDATVEAEASVDATTMESGPTCSGGCVHGMCIASGGCTCDANWGGPLCDTATVVLSPGAPVAGSVMRGTWSYFSFTGSASGLGVTFTETSSVGLVWGYLSAGQQLPTQSNSLASDENSQSATHTMTYSFASTGTQTWSIGVYGTPAIGSPTQVVAFQIAITVLP